ncbi:MAG: prolyl oligopeptidase family serine peptidase, partial [Anaerolineae bacterium]|nr:prolyl oligopeptidase family serine peptidase [Anaerolineae bacterium]
MKQKHISIFLLIVLALSILVGCASEQPEAATNVTTTSVADSTAVETPTANSDSSETESNDSSPEDQGPPAGGDMGAFNVDKSGDTELAALIAETESKFQPYTYTDTETDLTLPYNLYLPDDYDPAKSYPMVVFIADMSVVGQDVTAPLEQGYGGIIWASSEEQAKHESIVLVPEYPVTILDDHGSYTMTDYVELTVRLIESVSADYSVDTDRIYATGQSMGCMTFLYLASEHPDLFAAEIFVSGQWDVTQLDGIASQKSFYIVAEGDPGGSGGQEQLYDYLTAKGVEINLANDWDAQWSESEFDAAVSDILSQSSSTLYFANFKVGSTLPEDVAEGTSEHMYSFDYAYKIEGVRDWLFKQTKATPETGEATTTADATPAIVA